MGKAREIYTTMINDEESRKAIVDEFVKQVGLSKAAANTYYQMIEKKVDQPLPTTQQGNTFFTIHAFQSY
jgi:hypothetical protein